MSISLKTKLIVRLDNAKPDNTMLDYAIETVQIETAYLPPHMSI